MKAIPNISVSQLLAGAHAKFHNSVVELVDEVTPAALKLGPMYTEYKANVALLVDVVEPNTQLPLTFEIEKYDALRDFIFRDVILQAKKMTRHPDLAIREMATTFWRRIRRFEGADKYELAKETLIIEQMLLELKSPDLEGYIVQFFPEQTLADLESYNAALKSHFDQRQATIASTEKIDSKALRHTVNRQYADVVEWMNAIILTTSPLPAKVPEFIENMNALIDAYKRIIGRLRRGGSGNEKRPPVE